MGAGRRQDRRNLPQNRQPKLTPTIGPRERKEERTMPDETTFELASVHFGAEPVAVFRFGYERFELRARLGPGNLEHAIAAAAEVAASVFARWSHEALAFAQRFAPARTEGQCITRRVTNDCALRFRPFRR